MAESLTHKYIPRIEQTQENLFIEEYYSSTDTKIYFDDIEQTEIGYISYSLQEQLKPVFGYASMTFDDVAIGTRIVTGVFKVPIKNIEYQSSMEDIKKRSIVKTVEDYNDVQEAIKNTIDWTKKVINKDFDDNNSELTNSEDMEYKTKLINLGYELDYNLGENDFQTFIKKYQKDNNLDITGMLDTRTKECIDNDLMVSNKTEKQFCPKGTELYFGCDTTYDVVKRLLTDEEVIILNKDINGWKYVMTKDGIEGYIKS